ncbi:MAG TPA: helix-turn-helix domain-containing protein [Balneolaceae bacterium]|nr:helix-turn-helix domain-containing protein [Balneolaceae bacterium]
MNTNVFIPTEEKFREILNDTVDDILARRIPEIIRQANRKEYITTKEFRVLTGCSHRVQHYLREENKIPYSQEGRKIFYKTTDVEKFMAERRIEARDGEADNE